MPSTVKLISVDKMEFDAGDTDYNVMWSLDNNVESGEKVQRRGETGSILR